MSQHTSVLWAITASARSYVQIFAADPVPLLTSFEFFDKRRRTGLRLCVK